VNYPFKIDEYLLAADLTCLVCVLGMCDLLQSLLERSHDQCHCISLLQMQNLTLLDPCVNCSYIDEQVCFERNNSLLHCLVVRHSLFLTQQDEAESTDRSGSGKLEVEGTGMCHELKLVFHSVTQNAFNISLTE